MKQKLRGIHSRITLLELVLIGVWILLMQTYIAPNSFLAETRFLLHNYKLILLNGLPIAVVLVILCCLTRNSFVSGGIANAFFGLMSYANLLKIDGRDDPFVPGDIALLREALQATGEYRLDMHWGIVAIIVLSTAAMILLGIYLGKTEKNRKLFRLIAAVLALALLIGAYFLYYDNKTLYANLPVSNPYNITTVFNELGFNYCFLYNLNLYTAEKPDGYSASEVEKWESEYVLSPQTGEAPQVLMLMCEAFTDLNSADVFDYPAEEHPLRDYYAVCAQPNCISGSIIVPNFGAGTANTEFDVMTGMQTNLISSTSNSAMRSFFRDIPSMATVLSENGYDTLFLHPGRSWFYNRDSALSHMGIQSKIFIDDFEDDSGMDTVFLAKLTDELEKRTANGEKLFTYATTMQNHQAYNYEKYSFDIPRVRTTVPLGPEAEEYLSVYTYGVQCSAEMLLELTEYLNALSEPYVLVFFGDHLPNLGPDYQSYRELGVDVGYTDTPEQVLKTYGVPYIIWVNDAYLNGRSPEEVFSSLDLPEDGRISANFLGEAALELAGCENADPFFRFLYTLRREYPVIKTGIMGSADGVLTDKPDSIQAALAEKLHCWQYYRMTD